MTSTNLSAAAAAAIERRAPACRPRVAMILGSGLGAVAEQIEAATVIPYTDIPGFGLATIAGHAGRLHLGRLHGVSVACMEGRAHLFEGANGDTMTTRVRTLKLLGCEILLVTNAAGSLRADVAPGKLMLITDHINFQGKNPLVGPNDDRIGPRFPSLEDAYDPALRGLMLEAAASFGISLAQGVYFAVLGPSFETPAEIRAYRLLGADAVGMSTVPEVLVARHCGLRVVAISAITNLAAGMHPGYLSHTVTLQGAAVAAQALVHLIPAFVQRVGGLKTLATAPAPV